MRYYLILVFIIVIFQPDRCIASTNVGTVKVEIDLFLERLEKFKNDVGRYPTKSEGLTALREKPNDLSGWKGPYINKNIPMDAWGKPFIYTIPSKYSKNEFDLYSFGANGLDDLGQKDDITSWTEVNYKYYRRSFNTIYLIFSLIGLFIVAVIVFKVGNRKGKM